MDEREAMKSTEWKMKMLVRALLRIFKTGATLMEKIEKGIEIK